MAITFSTSISTTNLLNTYNNNVVEFSSDNVLTPTKCVITISSETFTISPNTSDVFRFNFEEVISVLMNNNFADDVLADADVNADTSLTSSFLVAYVITFSDDSTESTSETYVFVKSVEQIANVSTRLLTQQQILAQSNLTFFKGFPFDIAHYSDGNVTIFNDSLGTTSTLTETATNTYRLFILNKRSQFRIRVIADSGTYEENTCWTDGYEYELLSDGINTLDIQGTTSELLTVKLEDVCSGTYLKWFNRKGGWSYWLFHPVYKQNTKTKTLDTFNVDFDNIGDTFSTDLITGKTSELTRDLKYESLSQNEMIQLKSIFSSPRVEMYNGQQGEVLSTWQTVKVSDGNFVTTNTKREFFNVKLKIRINDYTQI